MSWISPQVLYHLLRAAERGHCEINRGIWQPAAEPQCPSFHCENKTSQQPCKNRVTGGGGVRILCYFKTSVSNMFVSYS